MYRHTIHIQLHVVDQTVAGVAEPYLKAGDRVCICGRSEQRVDVAVEALRNEFPDREIYGAACDVTDPDSVDEFGDYAARSLGTIHHWLNNAGMVSTREPLMNLDPREIVQVGRAGSVYTTTTNISSGVCVFFNILRFSTSVAHNNGVSIYITSPTSMLGLAHHIAVHPGRGCATPTSQAPSCAARRWGGGARLTLVLKAPGFKF